MLPAESAFFLVTLCCVQPYQATVAAISSSEVFNASSTLMNYSNEPDIFATDLQRRMPLALLLFPINKCLKCKVACTSIFAGLSHIHYSKFKLYTIDVLQYRSGLVEMVFGILNIRCLIAFPKSQTSSHADTKHTSSHIHIHIHIMHVQVDFSYGQYR